MGIASLILGIVSLIIGFIPLCGSIALLPAIVGVILAIIDIIKKNKTEENKSQSIGGLIISVIAIVIIIFWLIIGFGMEVETNSNFTNEYLQNKQIEEQQTQEKELIKQQEEQKAKEEEQKKKKEQEIQRQEQEKQNIENYKASCINYAYKDIARNPSNYNGKMVKFTGEVIQVSEGWFSSVTLRINVTKSEYGFYEDTIYCTYTYSENESKILQDDIVTIYGECKGEETYTSIFGQNITIPKVEIKYIELVNN